jgi:hypothetical protein
MSELFIINSELFADCQVIIIKSECDLKEATHMLYQVTQDCSLPRGQIKTKILI